MLEGGPGIDEGEVLFGLAFLVKVNCEGGEDEVATVTSSDAAIGVGGMAEGIESDAGDGLRGERGGKGVGEFGGVASGGEKGAVGKVLDFEAGVAGFVGGEGEGRPKFLALGFSLLLLPVRLPGKELGGDGLELLIVQRQLCVEFCEGVLLVDRRCGEDGFGLGVTPTTVDGRLIEEVEKPVVVGLGEGVVFVIVAATTIEGEAHPGRADGFGHVHDIVDAVFFGDGSAFAVDGMVSEESGGELLLVGGIGKEVACNLPDREIIEREIAIDCIGDPVAPGPHRAFVVSLIAIGVGVAGGIEPGPGHALSKGRIGEEAIDQVFPGLGRLVGEEGFKFFGGGWETTEVE